jgi:electron transfer flavoprotein beta subunit
MSVSGIVEAYGREVEVWGADKIDVADEKIGKAGSPTSVAKAFPKSLKPAGEQYDVDPEQAVGIIVSKLKEKFII